MGDGRAGGSSAIGDGEQAAISLTREVDGTHGHIFESVQLEGSYIGAYCVTESLCRTPETSITLQTKYKKKYSYSHKGYSSQCRQTFLVLSLVFYFSDKISTLLT